MGKGGGGGGGVGSRDTSESRAVPCGGERDTGAMGGRVRRQEGDERASQKLHREIHDVDAQKTSCEVLWADVQRPRQTVRKEREGTRRGANSTRELLTDRDGEREKKIRDGLRDGARQRQREYGGRREGERERGKVEMKAALCSSLIWMWTHSENLGVDGGSVQSSCHGRQTEKQKKGGVGEDKGNWTDESRRRGRDDEESTISVTAVDGWALSVPRSQSLWDFRAKQILTQTPTCRPEGKKTD
ncbi:unnamed protein product [Pleuronectes platessa]|uniref:Uncharacterized protein n=1 Tax=Pleuronectes platessa TaxID=8262 RepID=A0A9N7THE3_PLEPL|nr:unnamed protein product [Pleuronectes platessa]